MNQKMKLLIGSLDKKNILDSTILIKDLSNLLFPRIVEAYDCLILDIDQTLDPKTINFEKAIELLGDRTGYEASCNKIRINDYISYNEGNELDVVVFALDLLKIWEYRFKRDYPNITFNLIMSYGDGYVTIGFHILREDEPRWLADDLDTFKQEALLLKQF